MGLQEPTPLSRGDSIKEQDRSSGRRKLIKAAFIIALLSLFLAIAGAGLESQFLSQKPITPGQGKNSGPKKIILHPKLHPLDMIPNKPKAFSVKAQHKIPGAEESQAEAFLEPNGKVFSESVPFQIYIAVKYHGNKGAATRYIVSTMRRYPDDQEPLRIGKSRALTGVDADGNRLISWTKNAYSFEVDARFIYTPGQHYRDMVLKLDQGAAKELEAYADKVLAKSGK